MNVTFNFFLFILEASKFSCAASAVNFYLASLLFCQDVFLPIGRSFSEFEKNVEVSSLL